MRLQSTAMGHEAMLEALLYDQLKEGSPAAAASRNWRDMGAGNGSVNGILDALGYDCEETIWELAFVTLDMEGPHTVNLWR